MSDEREQKNSIFAAQQAAASGIDPRIPRQSALEKVKADFGLDVPNEVVPLPSNGKVYSQDSSFFGAEAVEIRSMTAREEDILTSRALLKKGTVITELIKSCLVDKSMNPLDLLSGDRNALMVAIRITGYGPEYKAELECPECSVKSPHDFNLANLPIKRLELEPIIAGANIFEFKLPYSGTIVRFKFMTGRDEEEMVQLAEKQKKLGLSNESNVTTNLLHSIISVDGIEDRSKIANFIKNMPARDSLALRNYVRDSEPGIVMKQDSTCNACGHTEEVTMPLGISFLWPNAG
jgi:hypothetical protein